MTWWNDLTDDELRQRLLQYPTGMAAEVIDALVTNRENEHAVAIIDEYLGD